MNTFPNKKLNPYLYPFKMKNISKEREIHTFFQLAMIQVINRRTDHNKNCTNKNVSSQAKLLNSVVTSMMFLPSNKPTVSLEILKTMGETFKRPKHMSIALKRPKTISTGLEIPKTDTPTPLVCLKPAHTVEEPQTLTNIPCLRPKQMQIAFERPKSIDIGTERPKSQDICSEKPESLDKPSGKTESPKEQSQESANQRPVSPDTLQRTVPTDEAIETPVPKQMSWTRMDQTQQKLDTIPIRVKVAMGVLSGMIATTAVHPLDVIKVRLQLFPKKVTTMVMFRRIVACEGTSGLYAGLTAGILRQLTYTGVRLAVYNLLYEQYKKSQGKYPDFRARLRIAVEAGLAGAFMGVPSEVALVRMIEVRRLRRSRCSPPCSPACKYVQRPEGAIKQLMRVARREGVVTWWRGAVPTLVRSVFVTSAQVGVYARVRAAFTRGDFVDTGLYLHMCTAGISSIFSAVLSLPVDQVKTRYQSYTERDRSAMDILRGMLRTKGVRYLWKGLLPYYVRQAVHTMITYVVLDHLIDLYPGTQEKDKP